MPEGRALPLDGIRVVEFSHMVMGPTAGMILGDLGADVVKIEPIEGDGTRTLPGAGAGFFRTFNRNKASFSVDLGVPDGVKLVEALIATADVVIENFRPGRMARHGLDYSSLSERHPRLVYLSLKGFLPGPYEHRTALDEVVQMMAGLAYMTGPPGQPLRAGSSVNDIMGGMFGALAVLAALRERDGTGRGQEVQSALFENCVLLSAQHMQQYAVTGKPPAPMPARISAWGIYDIFHVAAGEQIFLAVVTDTQWQVFCREFGLDELGSDARLVTNNQRVAARDWMMPRLRAALADYSKAELSERFERSGLPYAPIARPEELFEDPHLKASGGLGELVTEAGTTTPVPLLPIVLDGRRLAPRRPLPRIGEDTGGILKKLGFSDKSIQDLAAAGIIAIAE